MAQQTFVGRCFGALLVESFISLKCICVEKPRACEGMLLISNMATIGMAIIAHILTQMHVDGSESVIHLFLSTIVNVCTGRGGSGEGR